MRRPLRVGLTGGIASGKSTVADRFIELGVPLIDADQAARIVVEPGKPGLARLIERFGGEILDAAGALDRSAMRARIFNAPDSRRAVEAILHPLIRAEMDSQAAAVSAPYLVMAIPLLVEGGSPHERVDRVLLVDVPESTQVTRLLQRDNTSPQLARAMLAAQASRAERRAVADEVIENSGTVLDLRQSVDFIHQQYLKLAAGR